MAAIIIGIAIGCWLYAFVNNRYNKTPWIKNIYLVEAGLTAFLLGIVLIVF